MFDIAGRLKELRLSAKMTQSEVARMAETQQTSIQRYESGQYSPPAKLLLWYADYFDVSLDYIFGRTDNPQGKLYEYHPKSMKIKPEDHMEMEQFIEMCFDPKSAMSTRLKETMMKMMTEEKKQISLIAEKE